MTMTKKPETKSFIILITFFASDIITSQSKIKINELVFAENSANDDNSRQKTVQRNAAQMRRAVEKSNRFFAVAHKELNGEEKNDRADRNAGAEERGRITVKCHFGCSEHIRDEIERIVKSVGTEEYP